ncbi:hypothetical protein [Fredinandcohnia quinoae]|uniref:Uncharacterized protein n=1 Tax=Fredinandcohnia quinoae TaxID=2918902 RepID=A0AAW5E6Z2_9BACI|nr:hypothetical protein [Fredinandcohnia sp. SECRCQ15]MCH1627005.1 hypothetical protein [Fredinandcohnia sp. SECRCQ15]
MKKIAACLGLIIILGIISFIESEVVKNKETIVFSGLSPDEQVDAKVENENLENLIPSLEMVLVDTQVVNGNTVETYQEYEVYKDKHGEIIQKVPTEYYEFLEFWR